MQELLNRLIATGLTKEQAEASLLALSGWLEQHYPVAGVLVASFMREESTVD